MKYLFSLLLLLQGCVSSVSCPKPAQFGKEDTEAYPAVGKIQFRGGYCTGVLVSKQRVLTVTHCAGYGGTFVTDAGYVRTIVGWEGVFPGDTDGPVLGILDIPLEEVEPMHIARRLPPAHEDLEFVGYGCKYICITGKGPGDFKSVGSGDKHLARFSAAAFSYDFYRSDVFFICPGDSGGPVVNRKGEVVALASSFYHSGHGENLRFLLMNFVDPRILSLVGY